MNLRKLAGAVVVLFALFYTISNPHTAADFVHTVAAGIDSFATALASGGN
jgi:hypothetical protein